MPEYIKLSDLEDKMKMFREMYDSVRLIDPIEKKILELNNHETKSTREFCYKYWKEGKICDNCVSIRAYREDKLYMKLEQAKDYSMLVTAIPVKNTEKPVVLELMKNTTDMLMVGNGENDNQKPIGDMMYDMNQIIIKDHLTDAFNRRFVDERLPVDIIQADIANEPLSVIFLDLDNMKTINDTYGHQVGDIALKQVVSDMQSCINISKGWVARYGGDEFVVCLNDTSSETAYTIADKMIGKIKENRIKTEGCEVTISASYGIYTMKNTILSATDILNKADQEMYVMKKKKR